MDLDKIKFDRRGLLKAAGMGIAATGLSGPISAALADAGSATAKVGKDGKQLLPWSNWSGSQTSLPSLRLAPGSEDELIDMVKSSTQSIRCVGAGHSFNGLVPTDDTLMTLARMRGIESVNKETQEADIWAGTQLLEIGEPPGDDKYARYQRAVTGRRYWHFYPWNRQTPGIYIQHSYQFTPGYRRR
jgi:hypothetical protein